MCPCLFCCTLFLLLHTLQEGQRASKVFRRMSGSQLEQYILMTCAPASFAVIKSLNIDDMCLCLFCCTPFRRGNVQARPYAEWVAAKSLHPCPQPRCVSGIIPGLCVGMFQCAWLCQKTEASNESYSLVRPGMVGRWVGVCASIYPMFKDRPTCFIYHILCAHTHTLTNAGCIHG
jgi:hypothetical protein